jgi:hypothetical protein
MARRKASGPASSVDSEARADDRCGNLIAADATSQSSADQGLRDCIEVHPACDLLPQMPPDELRELGGDIRRNGLREPITIIEKPRRSPDGSFIVNDPRVQIVLDGRSRVDAMELAGFRIVDKTGSLDRTLGHKAAGVPVRLVDYCEVFNAENENPYAFVVSKNIHRRHLTAEQKRDVIAKLIKATPEKSDRQLAERTKTSPTTVGKVRKEVEATGDVSKLDTRTDSKGRKQPARKPKPLTDPAVAAAVERAIALARIHTEATRIGAPPGGRPKAVMWLLPRSRISRVAPSPRASQAAVDPYRRDPARPGQERNAPEPCPTTHHD